MRWSPIETAAARAGVRVTRVDGAGAAKAGADTNVGAAGIPPSGDGPYVLYFCSEQQAETAGIGSYYLDEWVHPPDTKPPNRTIFESYAVLEAFEEAGITEFYKVPLTDGNSQLSAKYEVTMDNTLVVCARNAKLLAKLAGKQCNEANVLSLLKSWRRVDRKKEGSPNSRPNPTPRGK